MLIKFVVKYCLKTVRPGKKSRFWSIDFWKLVQWPGGPFFFFFLNHKINFPNPIVQKVLKLEIQIKPVLIRVSCRKGRLKTFMSATQNADERGFQQVKKITDWVFFSVSYLFCGPHIFLFASKSTGPMTRTKTFFFLA